MLRDLEGSDRTVATVNAVLAVLLLAGLAVTGVWQFLFHDPDWDTHVVGTGRPVLSAPVGIADVHRTLADMAAILALWITGWTSYRILASVSRTGLAVVSVIVVGIVTGSRIRINAVVRDGIVDADARGYGQVFAGNYDFVIADRNDVEPVAAVFWTTVHIATLPLVAAIIWFAFRQSQRRQLNSPAADPSWLDRLDP